MAESLSDVVAGEMSTVVTDSLVGREKFSMERERRKSGGLYGDIKPSLGGGLGRGGVIGRYGMASMVGDAGSWSPFPLSWSSLAGRSATEMPRI